jgi:hypothetical protein
MFPTHCLSANREAHVGVRLPGAPRNAGTDAGIADGTPTPPTAPDNLQFAGCGKRRHECLRHVRRRRSFENGQRVFENGHPWDYRRDGKLVKVLYSATWAEKPPWKGNCTEAWFSSRKK